MRRAWIIGLFALAGCQGHAPAPQATTPSEGAASAATPARVPGASDPSECQEKIPEQPDSADNLAFVDGALSRLDNCTKSLQGRGHVAVSLVVDGTGAVKRLYVTHSTVRECPVVDCVRKQLSLLRAPAPVTSMKLINIELALAPGERPQRADDVEWPSDPAGRSCSDSDDILAELDRGRIPPEEIQSIIRSRYSAMRACYEAGLAANPRLRGRVTTRFVIGGDGHVSDASVLANDVHDCRVAQCVRDEIAKCVFPTPQYGRLTIVYPLTFEPR